MIVLLIAASLATHGNGAPRIRKPCQAVASLCLTQPEAEAPRIGGGIARAGDAKMAAYRFDARPCRIIGNMDCPKRAHREVFRLGEPIEQTLARSFGLD